MEAEFCVNGSSASNDQQFLGHAAFEAITFTRPPPPKRPLMPARNAWLFHIYPA